MTLTSNTARQLSIDIVSTSPTTAAPPIAAFSTSAEGKEPKRSFAAASARTQACSSLWSPCTNSTASGSGLMCRPMATTS